MNYAYLPGWVVQIRNNLKSLRSVLVLFDMFWVAENNSGGGLYSTMILSSLENIALKGSMMDLGGFTGVIAQVYVAWFNIAGNKAFIRKPADSASTYRMTVRRKQIFIENHFQKPETSSQRCLSYLQQLYVAWTNNRHIIVLHVTYSEVNREDIDSLSIKFWTWFWIGCCRYICYIFSIG